MTWNFSYLYGTNTVEAIHLSLVSRVSIHRDMVH